MEVALEKVATWQSQKANTNLCVRVKRCFGVCHTMLPYLPTKEQVQFQGLDLWTYEVGTPRALKSIRLYVDQVLYFPEVDTIQQVHYPSYEVAVLKADDIYSGGYCSVHVGQDFFQYCQIQSICRWIQNTGPSSFRVIEKTACHNLGVNGSFCNVLDKFIFSSGGQRYKTTGLRGDGSFQFSNSVRRYDIAKDVWKKMPPMNTARSCHSSCTLGTTVYVLGGRNKQKKCMNTMEKLDTKNLKAGWQAIEMPPLRFFKPRTSHVMAALSPCEILIMGGYGIDGNLSDALIFDSLTGSVRKLDKKAPCKFLARLHSSIQVRHGVVVTLVNSEGLGNKLIEFTHGSKRLGTRSTFKLLDYKFIENRRIQ